MCCELASVSVLHKIQNITINGDTATLAPGGWQLLLTLFHHKSDICVLLASCGCNLRRLFKKMNQTPFIKRMHIHM